MADRRFLAGSALTGVRHFWEPDGEGGGIITSAQDVTPILERNKALQTHDDGYSPSRELRRVAEIPNIVLAKWEAEGFDAFDPNNEPELKRRLNSSEWAYLRTAPGRL